MDNFIHKEENVLYNNPNLVAKHKDLPPPPPPNYDHCTDLKDKEKLDCYPEEGASKEKCEERGCCWISKKSKSRKKNLSASVPLDIPYCFYPENFEGYKYVNITETAFGLVAFLKRNYRSPYPKDVETIKMIVKYETESRVHIKVMYIYLY